MKIMKSVLFGFFYFFVIHIPASGQSSDDIDKLTTYATVLGRAVGCGFNVDYELSRVGKWMNKKFPPGTKKQKIYMPIFMEGMKYHAKQQKDGKSPDSCNSIHKTIREFPWP